MEEVTDDKIKEEAKKVYKRSGLKALFVFAKENCRSVKHRREVMEYAKKY